MARFLLRLRRLRMTGGGKAENEWEKKGVTSCHAFFVK